MLAPFGSELLANSPAYIRFMFHSKIKEYVRSACETSCYLGKWFSQHFYFTNPLPLYHVNLAAVTLRVRTVLCLSAAPVVKIIALIHSFGIFVSGLCLQSGRPYIFNVPCSTNVLIRGHCLSHCCWAFCILCFSVSA